MSFRTGLATKGSCGGGTGLPSGCLALGPNFWEVTFGSRNFPGLAAYAEEHQGQNLPESALMRKGSHVARKRKRVALTCSLVGESINQPCLREKASKPDTKVPSPPYR